MTKPPAENVTPAAPAPTPASGAVLPWIMWGLGATFYFHAFFHRVAPSVMVGELMRDLDLSAAALGNLSAFYFWGYGLAQLPTGVLADRWGPRRLLTAAAAICGASSFLFAFADNALVAYGARFLVGFGAGFGFVSTLKIVSEWFPASRFALLSGLTLMMGTIGGIAGQAPLAWLVAALGWRGGIVGAGLFGVFLGAAIWLAVRDRPAGTPEVHDAPHPLLGVGRVLRHGQTWIVTAAGFCAVGSLFAFGALWGVPYLMEVHGLTRPAAAFAASMMLIGWGVGAPVIGWWSDHLGNRRGPFVASSALALLAISAVLYAPGLPLWAVYGLLFVNGFAAAGSIVGYVIAREHHDPHTAGTAMALVNMGAILSGAVLQPVIGWLLDLNWEGGMEAGRRVYSAAAFDGALWVLPAFAVITLVLALLVRENK